MSIKPKPSHLGNHKYERVERKSGHVIYKCMLPGCPHFLPYDELAIGRESLCWGLCGGTVLIDREMVMHNKRRHPRCLACINERKERLRVLATIPMEEEEESYE